MDDIAEHWKARLRPLDGPRWPIRCGRQFSPVEVAKLRDGFWPRDMDDRWIVWLDGQTLRCWRSWTVLCVYEAVLTPDGAGGAVCGVLDVLDDSENYVRHHLDAGELERFEGVLSIALRPE